MTAAAPASVRFPVRAGFNLARAGNFPSVASNVLAAFVLSSRELGWPSGGQLGLALAAGCLAYAGGATLNDVADARFDAQHRPERTIPRRVVTRAAAAWLGGLELALGLGLLVLAGASVLLAAGLAAVILVYDWIHKRWSGSVVLMAGCRVLLALTIASLPGHAIQPAFLWWIGGLFVYIVVLSVLARWEYRPGAPAEKLGRMVGQLLAFIPLIDAGALLFAGAWLPALACAAAVPLGRWAQRLAAAT
jgi:4-hydroxybenzoate polyprenyltransferase